MRTSPIKFRTDFDHYIGRPLAPLELIEYGDFQCEYCADVYPVIKCLLDSFGDHLKIAYRHYPIPTGIPWHFRQQLRPKLPVCDFKGRISGKGKY